MVSSIVFFIFVFRMGDLNFVGLLRLTWVLMLARWFSSFFLFFCYRVTYAIFFFISKYMVHLVVPRCCFGINLKSAHSCVTFAIPSFWKSLHITHVVWFRGYVCRKCSYSFFFLLLTLPKFIQMKYALITIPTTTSRARERWNHWAC